MGFNSAFKGLMRSSKHLVGISHVYLLPFVTPFTSTKSLFRKLHKCDISEVSFILKPRIMFPDVGVHVDTDVPRFTTRQLDTAPSDIDIYTVTS